MTVVVAVWQCYFEEVVPSSLCNNYHGVPRWIHLRGCVYVLLHYYYYFKYYHYSEC